MESTIMNDHVSEYGLSNQESLHVSFQCSEYYAYAINNKGIIKPVTKHDKKCYGQAYTGQEFTCTEFGTPIDSTANEIYSMANDCCNEIRSSSGAFPIIRRPINIMISGSKVVYGTQSHNEELLNIDFKIIGGALDEIMKHPWSHQEEIEGKRILRIERLQQGCTLQAQFLVINQPDKLIRPTITDCPSFLEVACIRFDHTDGITTNYFITSVEVIEIVEFLIGNNIQDSVRKLKERSRIRSNLAALWFQNLSDLGPMILRFENQIRRYNSRNPKTVLKYRKLLEWENLGYALWKALLFYCICVSAK